VGLISNQPLSKTIHFPTSPYVGAFLSTILSKITILGLFILPFPTACNNQSHFFSISFEEKILIFVFFHFVFFTCFAKLSGVRSHAGVSHKSLAKQIFFISSPCASRNLFCVLSQNIIVFFLFFSDLYWSKEYLESMHV